MTPAEQATLAIAVVGIGATALTALAGLVVQVALGAATGRREVRRRRYEELIAAYGQFGRSLSESTYAYVELMEVSPDGRLTVSNRRKMVARIEEFSHALESRHGKMMLRLHDADPAVLGAIVLWQDILKQPFSETTNLYTWWDAQRTAADGALANFYELAGEHARSELLGPFRRWRARNALKRVEAQQMIALPSQLNK
jgi:hypothetical protein